MKEELFTDVVYWMVDAEARYKTGMIDKKAIRGTPGLRLGNT